MIICRVNSSAMMQKMTPEAQQIFEKIVYRSSAFALAALFIALTLEKLFIMAGAAIYGYSVGISYKEVQVIANPTSWHQESVLIIYLFPYLVQAIIIVFLYLNLQAQASKPGYLRILSLWVMFFITFRLLGMLPAHLVYKTSIYHAFNWLYLGLPFKIIISTIGILLFFVVSTRILKGILYFSATYNDHVRAIKLPGVIYSSLLIPVMVCCIISFLFYLPDLPKDEIIGTIVLAIVSLSIVARLLFSRPELFPKGEFVKEIYPPRQFFYITLILIIAFRIILGIWFS